jgi:hypothetical protein
MKRCYDIFETHGVSYVLNLHPKLQFDGTMAESSVAKADERRALYYEDKSSDV